MKSCLHRTCSLAGKVNKEELGKNAIGELSVSTLLALGLGSKREMCMQGDLALRQGSMSFASKPHSLKKLSVTAEIAKAKLCTKPSE